jgi:simple sugar transport system permease protein
MGFLFGLICCIAMWVLMDHTTLGFASRIVGGNTRAARIAGLSITKISLLACFLGGAAAALAGVVEVAAVQGRANDSLAAGYGYAGILVAFVARQNPLAVIPVSILLGGVAGSGDLLQSNIGLSSASVQVFQGTLFLVILGLDTWSGRLGEMRNAWISKPTMAIARLVRRKSLPTGVVHAGANA